MKKYILAPGFIRQNGERQFIGVRALCRLYGVSMDECIIYHPERRMRLREGLIWLTPRHDGNYEIPDKPSPQHPHSTHEDRV